VSVYVAIYASLCCHTCGICLINIPYAGYSFFYGALLQKRPIILCICGSLCPPYISESRMGLVGSLKLQVSYAGYSFFYRALLQKRPIILCICGFLLPPHISESRMTCIYIFFALDTGWRRPIQCLI